MMRISSIAHVVPHLGDKDQSLHTISAGCGASRVGQGPVQYLTSGIITSKFKYGIEPNQFNSFQFDSKP